MPNIEWPSELPNLSDGEVVLRAWRMADADAVFLACQDPQIQRYTRVPVPYLREHAEFFVGAAQQDNLTNRTGLGFAIVDVTAGELLGACGLVAVDLEARLGEAGYWAAPWARGRGATTRGLGLITRWALVDLGLQEVYVEVEDTNVASLTVAQHAGFRIGDTEPRYEEHRGAPRRFVTLVRIASDL